MNKLRLICLPCAALCLLALAWCGVSVALGTPLGALQGTHTCNCNACTNGHTLQFYECFHTTMDPQAQTCSTTDCIDDYVVFAECPEMYGGAACPLGIHYGLIYARQYWKDGAPSSCTGIQQDPYWMKQPTECSPEGAFVRCVVGSCGGDIVDTAYRWGRYVCTS